jgi:hypothetical protein
MIKDISDSEFDRLLDEHFSDDRSIKAGIKNKLNYLAHPEKKKTGDKNPFFGKSHSPETRRVISKKGKGLLVGKKNGMYGKTHSDEVKEQSRIRNKKNYEIKGGGTFLGKKHSAETKKIISDKKIGSKPTTELKPCYAIDPKGKKYDFESIAECVKQLNYPSLIGNAHKCIPIDGTIWNPKFGKFKGWKFARIIK